MESGSVSASEKLVIMFFLGLRLVISSLMSIIVGACVLLTRGLSISVSSFSNFPSAYTFPI